MSKISQHLSKNYYWYILLVAAFVVIYVVYKNSKPSRQAGVDEANGGGFLLSSRGVYNETLDPTKLLQRGDYSASTKVLQERINEYILNPNNFATISIVTLIADGYFDKKTEEALEMIGDVKAVTLNNFNAGVAGLTNP